MELNLDIHEVIANLYKFLDNELSQPGCAYDIVFQGRRYNFEPQFTKQGKEDQEKMRKECIRALLFDHINYYVDLVTLIHHCLDKQEDVECDCLTTKHNLVVHTLLRLPYIKENHEVKITSEQYLVSSDQIEEEVHENVKMQLENDKIRAAMHCDKFRTLKMYESAAHIITCQECLNKSPQEVLANESTPA